MEFNEKLQELRKQRGLTQEELAQRLYVTRTAVSKWESGRGYPNIESLKAIAKFFSVTLDELLSSDEVLNIAEENQKQTNNRFRDAALGILDLCASLLLILPVFAERGGAIVRSSLLITLHTVQPYLKIMYYVLVVGMIVWGILTLALQTCEAVLWTKIKIKISLTLSAASVVLFTMSLQPYAAVFMFVMLVIKALTLIKSQ